MRYSALLVVLLLAFPVQAQDVILPDAPIAAPAVGTPITLTPRLIYAIQSKAPVLVLASPDGVVSVTPETGPLKVKGSFVDRPDKIETRTLAGPNLYFVEVVTTGKVELLVIPSLDSKSVIRRLIDCQLGPIPPPTPTPVPPAPEPTPPKPPIPTGTGAWTIVVFDDQTPTIEQGKVLTGATLAGLRAAGKCRVYGSTTEASELTRLRYDQLMRDAGITPPALLVLDKGGKKVLATKLPPTEAALAEVLKGVMQP